MSAEISNMDEIRIKMLDIKKEIRSINARIEAQNKEIERIINLHQQMIDIIRSFSADDDDNKRSRGK